MISPQLAQSVRLAGSGMELVKLKSLTVWGARAGPGPGREADQRRTLRREPMRGRMCS